MFNLFIINNRNKELNRDLIFQNFSSQILKSLITCKRIISKIYYSIRIKSARIPPSNFEAILTNEFYQFNSLFLDR